jgi:hypothetical protein
MPEQKVQTARIADAAVTTTKISTGAITGNLIGIGAVSSNQIGLGAGCKLSICRRVDAESQQYPLVHRVPQSEP